MSEQRKPVDGGLAIEEEKNRQRVIIESSAKFRFFFAGLVFAILSFAIQFPIKNVGFALKLLESASWGFIAITALLALADIGVFSVSSEPRSYLSRLARGAMWVCFTLGVVSLLAAKICASFQA